jgi:subtilisin-like proprotein convertase family protein
MALLSTSFGWQANAQTEIPQANATLTSGVDFANGDIYTDSGGSAANYSTNENSTLNFAAAAGETITITFTTFSVEAGPSSCWDSLTVSGDDNGLDATYSGDDNDGGAGLSCTDATDSSGNPTLGPFTSSVGGTLSFTFTSDGSVTKPGWTATIAISGGGGGGGTDVAQCATDTPITFDPPYDISSTINVTETGVIGTNPGDYHFDDINLNVQDGWASDLEITLIAPSSATLVLSSGNGGIDGLDPAQTLTFTDSSGNDVTGWTSGAPLADYQPEGGLLNTFFAGEPVNGNWSLRIVDLAAVSDGGSLNSFCLNMTYTAGTPPIIACPGDIMADTDPGECGAVVNFGDATAIDPDGGTVTVTQTMGDPSGSVFPTGDTTIEFTATDDQGESSTCQFIITVTDNEAPVAVCQNLTIDLDPVTGMATIAAADVDNGSSDNCGIDTMTLDVSTFDCSMTGDNTVTLTVTDMEGNSSTCTSTVTVQDVTAPDITCVGGVATITESEDFNGTTIPAGWTTNILVGSWDWTFGSGDMPIGGDFATNAAIFDDDAAGFEDNVAELLSPVYDLSGATSAELSFDFAMQDIGGLGLLRAEVWDGAAWQEVFLADDADFDPQNTGAIDVLAYANAAFQVKYTWDDQTGWNWGAGVDNFLLSYEAGSGAGLDVVLDANGMATIPASDLILNVNEACGYTVTTAGVPPVAGNIQTLFASDNGGTNGGAVYFDITVGPADINISDIDINTDEAGSFTMDVYTLVGTYVGNTGDPTPWGTPINASGTASGTIDVPSNAVLDNTLTLTAGTTYGMALVLDSSHGHSYTNGDGSNENYSNADVSLALGSASNVPFDGSPFTPRIFNGDIHYTVGVAPSTTIDFDCSNLGENLVDVMVTDDSGNTATCTATVNVIDNTAPVLVCQDATIELGADGTATVNPEDLLASMPTTYNVMVIGSDNGSFSEGLTDFTVDVTEAATVTFDWDYTMNDTLTGFDSFGYVLNGTYFPLTDPNVGNQSGSASVVVAPGDVFGFRSQTDDNFGGNNETVISNFMPGFTGQFDPANWNLTLTNSDGDAYFVEIPGGPLSYDACGITVLAVDVTEVSCADIGTPITVTVFASDASGNIASCTSTVTVVDNLAPELTCPADQTVDPGAGNLFYEVPDYIATGEATVVDNCTDPVTDTTQDPAPGTALPDGTYTITLTATDEYGNTSTCDFELIVDTVAGVDDNSLDSGVTLYPNPASSVVNLVNKTNISLDTMTMFDVNGKQVNQVNLRDMQGEKAVDISSLAAGVYIVQIVGDNASTVKRLIVE